MGRAALSTLRNRATAEDGLRHRVSWPRSAGRSWKLYVAKPANHKNPFRNNFLSDGADRMIYSVMGISTGSNPLKYPFVGLTVGR
jgi:hypothetical protein